MNHAALKKLTSRKTKKDDLSSKPPDSPGRNTKTIPNNKSSINVARHQMKPGEEVPRVKKRGFKSRVNFQSEVVVPEDLYDFLPPAGRGEYENHTPSGNRFPARESGKPEKIKDSLEKKIRFELSQVEDDSLVTEKEKSLVLKAKKVSLEEQMRQAKEESLAAAEEEECVRQAEELSLATAKSLTTAEKEAIDKAIVASIAQDATVLPDGQQTDEEIAHELASASKKGATVLTDDQQTDKEFASLHNAQDETPQLISVKSLANKARTVESSRILFNTVGVATRGLVAKDLETTKESLELEIRRLTQKRQTINDYWQKVLAKRHKEVEAERERANEFKKEKKRLEEEFKDISQRANDKVRALSLLKDEAAALKKQQYEAALKKQQEDEAAALALKKAEEAKALALKKAEDQALARLEEYFANLGAEIEAKIKLGSEEAVAAVNAQDFDKCQNIAETSGKLKKLLAQVQTVEMNDSNFTALKNEFEKF